MCSNPFLFPLRYTLAAATSAADATEQIGSLISTHGDDKSKTSFVVCDALEVWIVNSCGKLWAAQRYTEGFKRISSTGLAVTQTIDKSSDNLQDTLKALGLWNGEVMHMLKKPVRIVFKYKLND